MHNTQTFLAVGHDAGNGLMRLDDDRLAIEWTNGPRQRVFQRIEEVLKTRAEATGGSYMRNPASERILGGNLMTVHPLGGCTMGADRASGVVNHKGQVFDASPGAAPGAVHAGLYVCDGAVIPCPLGIHPLLTITALAERAMILLARDYGLRQISEERGPAAGGAASIGDLPRPPRQGARAQPRTGLRAGAGAVPRRSRESEHAALSKSRRRAEAALRRGRRRLGIWRRRCRLAHGARRQIRRLLERGQEFAIGDYPDRFVEAQEQFQVSQDGQRVSARTPALYDLRLGKDIHVFVGCGLGGSSLINANVSLPPDPRVWNDPVWPPGDRDDQTRQEGFTRASRGAAAGALSGGPAARQAQGAGGQRQRAAARTSCGRRST